MLPGFSATTSSKRPVTVLLVSARAEDRDSLSKVLRGTRWKLTVVPTANDALKAIRRAQGRIGVVICEHSLPDGDWRSLLARMEKLAGRPNLVVSSRLADERLWADVLSFGAFDLLLGAPFEVEEVLRVTESAWSAWDRANRPAAVQRFGPGSARSNTAIEPAAFAAGS